MRKWDTKKFGEIPFILTPQYQILQGIALMKDLQPKRRTLKPDSPDAAEHPMRLRRFRDNHLDRF